MLVVYLWEGAYSYSNHLVIGFYYKVLKTNMIPLQSFANRQSGNKYILNDNKKGKTNWLESANQSRRKEKK